MGVEDCFHNVDDFSQLGVDTFVPSFDVFFDTTIFVSRDKEQAEYSSNLK